MFFLGGLQGLLGWYMVKSGLVNNPHVSQYRLTAHLGAAVLIYGYMFWVALGLLSQESKRVTQTEVARYRKTSLFITSLVVLMILTGGFVAGTRAGQIFNTFPLMAGGFIPPGMFMMDPLYINFFENKATIQFDHRIIAYALTGLVLFFWFSIYKNKVTRRLRLTAHLLLAMLVIQVTLGISTLLLVVPVTLGVAHQGGAIILFTIALTISHQLRK